MSKQRADGLYPYQPPNGTSGEMFMERYCYRCKRDQKFQETGDGEDGCTIILATMTYNTTDAEYPPEWVADNAVGRGARCTAFEEVKK